MIMLNKSLLLQTDLLINRVSQYYLSEASTIILQTNGKLLILFLSTSFNRLNDFCFDCFWDVWLLVCLLLILTNSSPLASKGKVHHLIYLPSQLCWILRSETTRNQCSIIQKINGPQGFFIIWSTPAGFS
uniref:Uncharacterized protein n=1 Tax=Spongospora subterranea TaxID=70186 RepID=A0A0H5R2L9_9EUKA|eukprot:CRZ02134.1 hypothetical protein [Spongospora subterranea]